MKIWKKNLTAAAVLVTVCAGIYLNWMYTEGSAPTSLTDTLDAERSWMRACWSCRIRKS